MAVRWSEMPYIWDPDPYILLQGEYIGLHSSPTDGREVNEEQIHSPPTKAVPQG